jgi:hypothetical protein
LKKIFIIPLFTLVIAVFSSCNKEEEPEQSFQYINLEFFEQFSSEGSQILFNLQTIETFPCSNFSLQTSITKSNNHTDIRITNIDVPDICVTALGPASLQLNMGDFSNVPSLFSIWVNEKRHDFELETTEKTIKVKQGNPFEGNLFFAFDSLLRIPENTVWGYIVNNPESGKNDIWDEILNAFYEEGAQEITLDNGNYFFFTVENQEIIFENLKNQTTTFYFQFENPIQDLIGIYERIIQQYEQAGIQLRIFNTNGERFVV